MDQDTQTRRAIERVRLELVTRKFMVMVLALIGVWVGITMCLTGAPAFIETWFSPWSRYVVGGGAFLAGLTVSIGGMMTDRRPPGWWTQVIGLAALTIWYFGMSVAYLGLFMLEGAPFAAPGEPLDPSNSGRGYVPLVYLGLMILTATPLVTMLRLARPGVMGRPDHGIDIFSGDAEYPQSLDE